MKVTIENVGKISNAEISVDGLTVIAAPNNTGKSTIGKAVFVAFDAFTDFQSNVRNDQAQLIERILRQEYPTAQECRFFKKDPSTSYFIRRIESVGMILGKHIVQVCDKRVVDEQELITLLQQCNIDLHDDQYTTGTYHYSENNKEKFFEALKATISNLTQDSEESHKIRMEILSYLNVDINILSTQFIDRYLKTFFKGQFTSEFINSPNHSSLVLQNHQGDIIRKLIFENGKCTEVYPIEDEHRRVFILDDPRIPESFGHRSFGSGERYAKRLLDAVLNQQDQVEDNPASGLTETVSNSKAIRQITDMLNSSFNGHIEFDAKGEPILSTKAPVRNPIKLTNASMGVKAYIALRYLIENAIIHDGDILVLDEPEIHLHPEWQVAYAHALVLTAKLLGIHLIITTHSPFFLKALVAYSNTEGIADSTHYYTAKENSEGPVSFHEINGEGIAKLYARMAAPLMKIDSDVRHG